ncbi:hypothetical protein A3Q56_08138 [Intoshia linei]|uniref:Uncharacterized protein n=1 Tax=Intoshia linei TaxID=1819745 RepID=A0A177AQ51_9BILA|nr:hypothetical protein A3Q56_08138 [Intoshia linei]
MCNSLDKIGNTERETIFDLISNEDAAVNQRDVDETTIGENTTADVTPEMITDLEEEIADHQEVLRREGRHSLFNYGPMR